MPSHLFYFKGLWLPYVLLLDLLSHLRASGPSSIPKCLCGQVCVFSFQLSHFYHQNEAVERKGEPLETLKRKKNLVIQFSAKILSFLWLLSRQIQTRQENQSRETYVETWWKSACLVVLLLVGLEVDRKCRSLHLVQKAFVPTLPFYFFYDVFYDV